MDHLPCLNGQVYIPRHHASPQKSSVSDRQVLYTSRLSGFRSSRSPHEPNPHGHIHSRARQTIDRLPLRITPTQATPPGLSPASPSAQQKNPDSTRKESRTTTQTTIPRASSRDGDICAEIPNALHPPAIPAAMDNSLYQTSKIKICPLPPRKDQSHCLSLHHFHPQAPPCPPDYR